MKDYTKIAEEALRKAKKGKSLNESIVYPEGMTERMHPKLEEDLINQTHSLGKHPIFPEGDETNFEQKVMGERFSDVAKRYKRANDIDRIDNNKVMSEMMPLVKNTMELEAKHKRALEKLAEEMIREEFDMDEEIVEIHAELTTKINMVGTKKNPKPTATTTQFKNHDELVGANEEVYKRRFINSMIQGAAKKCNHMFHMVDDELTDMDPRLPNKYAKMMAAADYMFYIMPEMENGISGGVVKVQFPTAANPKAVIYAQALVFPVLLHELVKGVMELMSAHGLPKNKRIGEYVINKADFLAAEPWDMRIGPGLWERFIQMIEPDDFNLKHHIYTELVSLPVHEFNTKMREIMGGTKEGKKIIKKIVDEVKAGLHEDEFNEAMGEMTKKDEGIETHEEDNTSGFTLGELLGGEDSDETQEGFRFEDLI